MKYIFISIFFLVSSIFGEELKIKSNSFKADEKTGISVFEGNVNIVKLNDEINASRVTINIDKNHKPVKFIADGGVSFTIQNKDGSIYSGKAGKVIFYSKTKEYHFYNDVRLSQVDEKKEIIGEEVVLKTIEAKAYAKGKNGGPVIMIFDVAQDKDK